MTSCCQPPVVATSLFSSRDVPEAAFASVYVLAIIPDSAKYYIAWNKSGQVLLIRRCTRRARSGTAMPTNLAMRRLWTQRRALPRRRISSASTSNRNDLLLFVRVYDMDAPLHSFQSFQSFHSFHTNPLIACPHSQPSCTAYSSSPN